MRARRPSGGPAFPFPPRPAERSLSVVKETGSERRDLSIRTTHETTPDYEVVTRQADLEQGGFVFYSETFGPNVNDKRMIEIQRKNGHWKASALWQAEGTGEPPAVLNLFRMQPECFNRGVNGLLYDMNFMVNKMITMLDKLGFGLGYDPKYPDDEAAS
jgi:hypothetical protein